MNKSGIAEKISKVKPYMCGATTMMMGTYAGMLASTVFAADAKGLLVECIKVIASLIVALALFLIIGGLVNYAESRSDGSDGPSQNKALGKMAAGAMLLILSIYLMNGGAATLAGFVVSST